MPIRCSRAAGRNGWLWPPWRSVRSATNSRFIEAKENRRAAPAWVASGCVAAAPRRTPKTTAAERAQKQASNGPRPSCGMATSGGFFNGVPLVLHNSAAATTMPFRDAAAGCGSDIGGPPLRRAVGEKDCGRSSPAECVYSLSTQHCREPTGRRQAFPLFQSCRYGNPKGTTPFQDSLDSESSILVPVSRRPSNVDR